MRIKNPFRKRRYCPKCSLEMERVKVKSNSEAINGCKSFYQCPECKGILFSP